LFETLVPFVFWPPIRTRVHYGETSTMEKRLIQWPGQRNVVYDNLWYGKIQPTNGCLVSSVVSSGIATHELLYLRKAPIPWLIRVHNIWVVLIPLYMIQRWYTYRSFFPRISGVSPQGAQSFGPRLCKTGYQYVPQKVDESSYVFPVVRWTSHEVQQIPFVSTSPPEVAGSSCVSNILNRFLLFWVLL